MNFLKYIPLYICISLLILLPGIGSLVLNGLQPSIDFVGGSLLAISISGETTDQNKVKEVVENVYSVQSVQLAGDNEFLIKGDTIDNDTKNMAVAMLNNELKSEVTVDRFETIGPTLSQELLKKTYTAIAIVAVMIALYVAKQFKEFRYGVVAVLAMFHDSLVLLGSFSIFGYLWGVEVDVLFVTAVLTTLSFSVHDTIVVFDRIRELRIRNPRSDYKTILNTAITETLSRSINNSVTIIIMLLALSLLGGESIRWFSISLLIGSITGTYSSPFVAVPLLLGWERWVKKKNL